MHTQAHGETQCERDLLGGPALPFHKVLDSTLRAITNTHSQMTFISAKGKLVEKTQQLNNIKTK